MVASGDGQDAPNDVRSDPGIIDLLDDLTSLGVETAPHVVRMLQQGLGGDAATIREAAASLSPAQRAGLRALPEPLPCVPPISSEYSGLVLQSSDRETLLLASLLEHARVDILLETAGLAPEDLLAPALIAHLDIAAGRFAFRDRRFAVWLLGTADQEELKSAHARLGAVHTRRGEDERAAWHRARSAVVRDPGAGAGLLPLAQRLLASGRAGEAFRVAVEAFDHAEGDAAEHARLIAGTAALGEGRIDDAVDWLGSAFAAGAVASPRQEQALAGLITAETLQSGAVPLADPADRRPHGDDARAWREWARASAVAAIACAERRSGTSMRLWLQELREADRRAGARGALRDPAVALCCFLSGEEPPAEEVAPTTLVPGLVAALTTAVSGDVDSGLETLTALETVLSGTRDPLLGGTERSPLGAAYVAVIEILLRLWQGDIAGARERLIRGAEQGPIALPFAGLGAHLARRLDLAVLGHPGGLSLSVTASLPSGIRYDPHVDRAIEAYLAGAVEDAADHVRIWHDRGAPEPVLGDGGIEELGPREQSAAVEPVEAALARELCHRIRAAVPAGWHREYADLVDRTRQVRSPFRRGRVEALLGTTCVIRGDRAAGRRHLRLARRLFEDAGADAWSASVDMRLARLGDPIGDAMPTTVPIAFSALDPLSACRAAWSALLTEREIQVAMLIVEGAANRAIAEQLDVSIRTVEVHAGRVFSKLDVHKRGELIVLAHRTNQHV